MTHVRECEGRTSGHILSLTERKRRIRHWAGSKGAPIPVPSPAPDPLRPGASHVKLPEPPCPRLQNGGSNSSTCEAQRKQSSRTRLSYETTRMLVLKNTVPAAAKGSS